MVICEGELTKGDNGKGDCENGEGERIVGKGEPDFFVSLISLLGTNIQ